MLRSPATIGNFPKTHWEGAGSTPFWQLPTDHDGLTTKNYNGHLLERLMGELPESYLKDMKPLQQAPGKMPIESPKSSGLGPCSVPGIESLSNLLHNNDFSELRVDSLCEVLSSIHPSDDVKIAALRGNVEYPIYDAEQDEAMIANLTSMLRMTMDGRQVDTSGSTMKTPLPRSVHGNRPSDSLQWTSNGLGNDDAYAMDSAMHPSMALGVPVAPPPPPLHGPPPSAFVANTRASEYAPCAMQTPLAKSLPIPSKLASPACVSTRRTQPLASDIHTLIIKKIPARIAPSNLLDLWPAYQSYNLLYLPYNHRTRRTAGFVIVNFVSNEAAAAFRQRWQGQFLLHESSVKKLDICVAEVQGFVENLIAMKKNKKITRMKNARYLPVVILPDGTPTDFKQLMETIQLPADHCQKEGDGNSADEGDSAEEYLAECDDDDVAMRFSC